MGSTFKAIQNQSVPATPSDLAYSLTMDIIEAMKARRDELKALGQSAKDLEPTPEDLDHVNTIKTLLEGRHRGIVMMTILREFPEILEFPGRPN